MSRPAEAGRAGFGLRRAAVGPSPVRPARRLQWLRDGTDWPQRESSTFVSAGGVHWHVQRYGQGPAALLVHGTGSATHTWRGLGPRLARDHTVIAVDLPGHGFSGESPRRGRTLPGMAGALAALLEALRSVPRLAVGHSAGAAIITRMALDGRLRQAQLVSINGAFEPFPGLGGPVFTTAARLLFVNPLVPALFAGRARDRGFVERLLARTGSSIDPAGLEFYARLARDADHVRGALGMMAEWDLRRLSTELPDLRCPLLLIAGQADTMVPPAQALRLSRRVPAAVVEVVEGLGHLAHEEEPARIDAVIRAALQSS